NHLFLFPHQRYLANVVLDIPLPRDRSKLEPQLRIMLSVILKSIVLQWLFINKVTQTYIKKRQLDIKKKPEVHRAAVAKFEQKNPGNRVERRAVLWKVKAFSGPGYDPNINYENDNTVAL
ncbi:hypothetical protein CBL_20177, partial [Carabus blaptoides fortunei]